MLSRYSSLRTSLLSTAALMNCGRAPITEMMFSMSEDAFHLGGRELRGQVDRLAGLLALVDCEDDLERLLALLAGDEGFAARLDRVEHVSEEGGMAKAVDSRGILGSGIDDRVFGIAHLLGIGEPPSLDLIDG